MNENTNDDDDYSEGLPPDVEKKIENCFKVFDRNGDNSIDGHELKQVLEMMG